MAKTRVSVPIVDRVECIQCILHARPGWQPEGGVNAILSDRTASFVESYLEITGGGDPLGREKSGLNKAAMESVKKPMWSSYESMLEHMARANGVDWGMKDYSFSGWRIQDVVSGSVLWLGEPEELASIVESSKRIAIVLDNAGEAIVDIIAAGWLARRGHSVTLIARSSPYEVDVTASEAGKIAERIGVDARIASTGSHYPAFHRRSRESEAWEAIVRADMVLSKGIANFEAATESGRTDILEKTVFLLRAKCKPIARTFQAVLGTPMVVWGRMLAPPAGTRSI